MDRRFNLIRPFSSIRPIGPLSFNQKGEDVPPELQPIIDEIDKTVKDLDVFDLGTDLNPLITIEFRMPRAKRSSIKSQIRVKEDLNMDKSIIRMPALDKTRVRQQHKTEIADIVRQHIPPIRSTTFVDRDSVIIPHIDVTSSRLEGVANGLEGLSRDYNEFLDGTKIRA